MPSRTLQYTKFPWTGGINTSVEPGALPDNDLVIADNIIFGTSQARKKREGNSYFDLDLPLPTSRSSAGTTRRLIFDESLQTSSPDNQFFVVGERIKVTSTGSETNYVSSAVTCIVTSISTTNISNDTLSYTFSGAGSLSESDTPTGTLIIKRNSHYIDLRDYWRYDDNFAKQQLLMAFSDQGKLFKHDAAGRRKEITTLPEQFTVTTVYYGLITTGFYWDFDTPYVNYRVWYDVDSGGGAPSAGGRTLVPVIINNPDSSAAVATKTKTELDLLGTVTTTLLSHTLTVTLNEPGAVADAVGSDATFTIAVTQQGTGPFPDAILKANSIVFNDRYILGMNGENNRPLYYRPEEDEDHYFITGETVPNFQIIQEHIGRLWTDDKDNVDRVNYCSPGDDTEWLGVGDSGALDIVPGDGDPDGVTSIYKSFKGTLFVAKGTHLYRIDGDSPEDYFVNPVTKGLGCVAHKAATSVDMDDIIFVSKKGIHGLAATQEYGDFAQSFLSLKIQNNFNTDFNRGRLDYIQSAYVADLNSIAFAVPEGTETANNFIWLLNTITKEWYRWPNISCTALATRLDQNSKSKLITGTSESRIIQAQNGTHTDLGSSGIQYRIRTGVLYPDGNPTTVKRFLYVGFIYRPVGHYRFTAQVTIDNASYQNLSFEEEIKGDKLGETFVLGSSVLGTSNQFSSFRMPVDGIGRGLTIDIFQSGTDETVELYGVIIGYEPAGDSQETL